MTKAYDRIMAAQQEYQAINGYAPSKIVMTEKYSMKNFQSIPITILGMTVEILPESPNLKTFYVKGYKGKDW